MFPSDQRLKDRARTRARGITISALLDRPGIVGDAENDVGRSGYALLSDNELHLPSAGGSEAGQQPRSRDRVLDEIHVSN